jgi:arabinoxylan arabinofuranohydrolase
MLINKSMKIKFLLSVLMLSGFCFGQNVQKGKPNINDKPYPYGNPIIHNMYTADAAPKIMPDGRLWMVTSVDSELGGGYSAMHAVHAFSTADMVNWVDEGELINLSDLGEKPGEDWAIWAPDIVYKNGIYYLYFPMRNILADGSMDRYCVVAESNSLHKKFKVTNPRIEGANNALDPSVFVDDDGTAYLYWNQMSMAVLKDNMREINGKSFKLDIGAKNFMEASWMDKRHGIYYFNYHTKYGNKVDKDNPDDPNREKSELDYSMGNSPKGPLIHKGVLNYELGVNVNDGPKYPGKNYVPWRLTQSNHGGVVEFHGQEYLFYHTSALSSWRQDEFKNMGTWTQRSVCVDSVKYNADGTIIPVQQTIQSVGKVIINQPFSISLPLKNAKLSKGMKIKSNQITALSGSSIAFEKIDLGTGYYYFSVKVENIVKNGRIEIRRDSPDGYLMGTIKLNEKSNITNNGVSDTFLREAYGKHTVYMIFSSESNEKIIVSKPQFFAGSPQK